MDWPPPTVRVGPTTSENRRCSERFGLPALRLSRRGQTEGQYYRRLLLATSAGALLSAALNSGQTYLPGRVTSVLDIVLNTAGSLGGGAMALVLPRLRLSRHVYQSPSIPALPGRRRTRPGSALPLGRVTVAPLVPSLIQAISKRDSPR